MRYLRLYRRGYKGIYLCSSKLQHTVAPIQEWDMEFLSDCILDSAYFYAFRVITYAVTPAGFRVLLGSSKIKPISDSELIDRYSRLNPSKKAIHFRTCLKEYGPNTEKGRKFRKEQTDKMQNMSYFIRSLKQRFARYFMKEYALPSPLWQNVYICRPVEYGNKPLIAKVAAFVDAWPVYEADDPDMYLDKSSLPWTVLKSYNPQSGIRYPELDLVSDQFSGLGQALRGSSEFRKNIRELTGTRNWPRARDAYLKLMAGTEHLLEMKRLPSAFGNINVKELDMKARKEKWNYKPVGKRGGKAFAKEMVKELREYKKRHGHCDIPRTSKENPRLGKWLNNQRMRRRKGELPLEIYRILEDMGVTWEIGSGKWLHMQSPVNRQASKEKWEKKFKELEKFVKKNGHAQVPARCSENPGLGYWAWDQRRKRSAGKLSEEQISRLDRIGFEWDIELGVTSKEKVVRVVDGDTFYTENRVKSVRLANVDTPERGEEGYKEAKKALEDLIKGKKVDIYTVARDIYGRHVAHVTIGAISVNEEMKKYKKR